jgi:hypothetical protein
MSLLIGVAFNMDNKFVFSAWAFIFFGAFNVLGLLFSYSYIVNIGSSSEVIILILASVLIVVSFLAFLCGIYLLKNNGLVHKIALPVSIAIMVSVPVGTAVGALYLWQRHENL